MTRNGETGDQIVDERPRQASRRFPITAGILLGLGLGGFFDSIVLHQLLQWHHLVSSAGYPPDTVENMRINVFADGPIMVAFGVLLLRNKGDAPVAEVPWSSVE